MSMFDTFLLESNKVRAKYKVWIERNPDDKDRLTQEMNKELSTLLDNYEKKETDAFSVADQMKTLGITKSKLKITKQ